MPRHESAVRTGLLLLFLGVAALIALPFVIIALMVCEHFTFGTRYVEHAAEAIGMTPVLQAIFDALGING